MRANIALLLSLLFSFLPAASVSAPIALAAPGDVAVHFRGNLYFDNAPAPDGTKITALVARSYNQVTICGTGTVSGGSGHYTLDTKAVSPCATSPTGGIEGPYTMVADGENVGGCSCLPSLNNPLGLGQTRELDLRADSISLLAGDSKAAGPMLVPAVRLWGTLRLANSPAPLAATIRVLTSTNKQDCGTGSVIKDGGVFVVDVPPTPQCANSQANGPVGSYVLYVNDENVGGCSCVPSLDNPSGLGEARRLDLFGQQALAATNQAPNGLAARASEPRTTPCPPGLVCGGVSETVGTPPTTSPEAVQSDCTLQDLAGLVFARYGTGEPIGIVPVVDQPNTYLVLLSGTELVLDQTTHIADDVAAFQSNPALSSSYNNNILAALQQAAVSTDGSPPHLIIVGHSLGGMAAQNLVASDGFVGNYIADRVITFGSPQTADNVDGTDYVRVDALGDIVPRLGPLRFQIHPDITVSSNGFDTVSYHMSYPSSPDLSQYDATGAAAGTTCMTLDMSQMQGFASPF